MSLFRGEQLAYRVGDTSTDIKAIHVGTVSVDPADLATAVSAETAVTIPGLEVGDVIEFYIPASLETGLAFSGGRVSAIDTAQLRLSNVSAGSVNGIARTWTYKWYDLT